MTLDSPEVVVLDTSVVQDVLGLKVRYPDAEPTRVLPGRIQNSVCVLVPDARATPRGFHDVTLVDMTRETGLTVSMVNLRRQWPTSLLMGMTRWQTDLEALRRECKSRFQNLQEGSCTYCGRNIIHDMARHVSNYYQDYIDHIHALHHVGISVKTANLGKWFPPWTVTRSAWNMALKTNVLGISIDVVLFSEHGAQLFHHYRVFGDCVLHGSLHGPFMLELSCFTSRACAEARSVVKCGWTRVLDPVCHRVDRLRRPLGLCTA